MTKKKKTFNRILNAVTTVILVLLIVLLIFMFIARASGNSFSLFGFSFFRVQSGSMEPTLQIGDVIMVQKTSANDIHKGDIVLTVPAQSPVDGAVMLMNYNEHRYLRKVKVLDDRNVLLQSYDREYEAETVSISEIGFIARCVKVTFELA